MKSKKKFEEDENLNQNAIPNPEVETDSSEGQVDTQPEEEEVEVVMQDDLEQKCNDLNDKNLRLMAEFDNFRKRTLREKADLIKNGGERVFVDMLPIVDDFERAIQAMEDAEDLASVKEGVGLIYDKFIAFLNRNGIAVIPTENEAFDVEVHEAITTFPSPSEELKGKIIDCTSKGYTFNDKVIRYAKVVVGE